ncbi:MAG: hypothetical protein JXB48_10755, partial [Candidatus Latescibacteria bacterium]|nr:hypothetical protein [Candidatus Latescibacterota bacterium]
MYGKNTFQSDFKQLLMIIIILLCHNSIIHSQSYSVPFFPDGTYDKSIPAPLEVLGFPIGEKPVSYEEAVHYIKTLANASPRVQIFEAGETFEKRTLYYLIISSEENCKRLDTIRENLALLADPRKLLSEDKVQEIIDNTPAVAWMMYSIHGDELSGVDASLQLAYQLAAGTDPLTEWIRRELVVGIDPMENPDGRARYLAQMQQWGGSMISTDAQSIKHTGVWPWGRTNHYLFDLNRDWFILANPESRARVKALRTWHPQVVVDAHEMGSYDTYLFNPPREPFNHNFHSSIFEWWNKFSADQAKAFDRYGWSYYSREWNEEWFPGYGTSFLTLMGAVGILYEQAQTDGSTIKRPDGTELTASEAIHHQFTSSMANITTTLENSKTLLLNYYNIKKDAIQSFRKNDVQVYYIDPSKNPSRAHCLVERLLMIGIEVETLDEATQLAKLNTYRESGSRTKTLPKGTYVIRTSQPLRPVINSILEFDPRMTTAFVQSEREYLEKGKGTRLYDPCAWSMLLAYDVDAYTSTETPRAKTTAIYQIQQTTGEVTKQQPAYGYLIDYRDDHAVDALLQLFAKDYQIRSAREPFIIEGRSYPRGTLLIRNHENPSSLASDIQNIARTTQMVIYGVDTAQCTEGPDLGGGEFILLEAPRVALLTGPEISSYSFGTLWYMMDYELQMRHTILNHDNLGNADLRKYNVLVMPSSGSYKRILGDDGLKKIKDWVSDGGTLIAISSASAFLADSTTAFSKVKIRRQALEELEQYKQAVLLEDKAGKTQVDSLAIWEKGTVQKEET